MIEDKILANDVRFSGFNFDKLNETYRISEQIINQLTPEATLELLNSTNDKDLDTIFDLIVDETYMVLYGNNYNKTINPIHFGYLDKLSTSIDETLRCEDIGYFITNVLPDFEMSTHHLDWCRVIQLYKWFCILASRDHGKSFFFSNAYAAWMLYKYKPITPKEKINNRGLLFSFSITQAVDLLSILKDNIEGNDILRARLFNKDKWSKTDITCANRARLTVKGFGSSVRGVHPFWIMVDDGLKDNVIYSQDQRVKTINYFHAVIMNAIIPGGKVGVVGTPFHNRDLYGDLKEKVGWNVFEYPAIFPDGRVLWENRYSFLDLMEKRKAQGNLIFSREMLCRPITSDATIFPIEILNTSIIRMENYTLVQNRESFPIKFERVVSGLDFAMSSSVGSDYSVFTTWGIDDKEQMWLLHAIREKGMSFAQQMAIIKYINSAFRPDVMVMENNQMQQIFVQESDRQGVPVIGHHTGVEKHDLKNGWAGLALLFERGKIKLPYGDQKSKDFADMTIMEFSSVAYTETKGICSTDEHDDICSSFWLAGIGTRKTGIEIFNFTMI